MSEPPENTYPNFGILLNSLDPLETDIAQVYGKLTAEDMHHVRYEDAVRIQTLAEEARLAIKKLEDAYAVAREGSKAFSNAR